MQLPHLKRLIVLEGVSNSGKTTTLNEVCDSLKKAFPQSKFSVNKVFKSNGGSPDDHLLVAKGKAGQLTAIHTSGDDANRVVRSFGIAERYKCEVLVMAVSTPVRSSTLPLAKIAFEEIVKANALRPQWHYTQGRGPANALSQKVSRLSKAIWQQM